MPSGFCECGCGQKTQLAKKTSAYHGTIAGQPRRFIKGHHRARRIRSDGRKECRNCRQLKKLDDFPPDKRSRDNRSSRCRQCIAEANRERYDTRADYKRAIKRKYGITWEEYESLLEEQGGSCAICKQTENLVVDHCHRTNRVRGIICKPCNTGLGNFKDNSELLRKAARYAKT